MEGQHSGNDVGHQMERIDEIVMHKKTKTKKNKKPQKEGVFYFRGGGMRRLKSSDTNWEMS